jgi:pimeloyl-ACP methyl ester carboxylesterase
VTRHAPRALQLPPIARLTSFCHPSFDPQGQLVRFGPAAANVAFISAPPQRKHLVFVGGLTDGLLATAYLQPLAPLLAERGFGLVQTLLSSSHTGWGLGSLDQDADELLLLTRHLRAAHSSAGVVMAGQSTGCQDAVRYAARCARDPSGARLLGVVLQAPVSDREWLATQPGTAARLALSQRMVDEGRGEEVAFRATDVDGAAVSARRWCSLAGKGGDDDMFSSDLGLAEMQVRRAWRCTVCVPRRAPAPPTSSAPLPTLRAGPLESVARGAHPSAPVRSRRVCAALR